MSRFRNASEAHLLAHTLGMRLFPGQPVRVESYRADDGGEAWTCRVLVGGKVAIEEWTMGRQVEAVTDIVARLESRLAAVRA